jgi:polyphosphate glucokinase
MAAHRTIGIDVGASFIKCGLVDVETGGHVDYQETSIDPARTPDAVVQQVAELADKIGGVGEVGVTLPAVVRDGTVQRAANLHSSWSGVRPVELFADALSRPVAVLNDADAAGLAEMRFGAAARWREAGHRQVLVLTFGTGIGSALFMDGQLVPNTELGHLRVHRRVGETRASARAKRVRSLSWEEWADRVTAYLAAVEMVLNPDLLVLGGGISRQHEEWMPLLRTRTPTVPAGLRGEAGLVGAALFVRRSDGRGRAVPAGGPHSGRQSDAR